MNASEADTPPTEAAAAEPDAPAAAATANKPPRKRAPRKTAGAAGPAVGAASEGTPVAVTTAELAVPAAPGEADPVPTKRAPRKRAAKAAAPTGGGPADAPGSVPEAAHGVQAPDVRDPAGAVASTRPAAVAPTASTRAAPRVRADVPSGMSPGVPAGGPDPAPTTDSAAATAVEAQGPALPDGSEGAAGTSARRSRNRRRGRRGGARLEGAAPGETPEDADGMLDPDTGELLPGAAGLERERRPRQPGGEPQPPREVAPLAGEVFAQVLSGAYDELPPAAEDEADAAKPAKRVLAPDPDAPKLHKVLAQAGVASRRDLEQMVVAGRITVNGQPAHTGQRVSFGDRIQLDGKPVRYRIAPPPPRVLAYHKPAGEVVTHDDPQARPTVFRRLPRLAQGKWQSVGRLDINTEGLLLFTNSGELANQLMHPRFGVEREYAVRSLGVLDGEAQARLLEGVELDGQRCAFKSIEDGGGEGVNHWYRVVITEGRNREVRRLFEAAGHAVSRLIRIRYGSVVLPRGLKRGVWVDLDAQDLRDLRRLASGPRAAQAEGEGSAGPRRGRNRRAKGKGGDRDRPLDRSADRGPRPARPERPERPERTDRPERTQRLERPPRGPRNPKEPRAPRPALEPGDGGFIPNPLQQTFDKRAIQQARKAVREIPEDGPIPNPLQQTFDKRALQQARRPERDIPEDGPIPNPLQQTYDKRFVQNSRGGKKGPLAADPERIPDPMMTSVGYIGADAFRRKQGGGGGSRNRRGAAKPGGPGRPGGPTGPRGPRGGRNR